MVYHSECFQVHYLSVNDVLIQPGGVVVGHPVASQPAGPGPMIVNNANPSNVQNANVVSTFLCTAGHLQTVLI